MSALLATVLASIGMAVLLRFKVRRGSGLQPLILFCLGVALWTSGHLAINFGGPGWAEFGQALVNMSPIVPAFFVHFALEFIGFSKKKNLVFSYGLAIASATVAIVLNAGDLRPWSGFERFYQFDQTAMVVAGVTAAYGVFGHLCLLYGKRGAELRKRRQINAVFLAGVWGLISASGFLMGSIKMELFPYPVLLLPFYTVFLVYGILRYELMDINILARKSVAWFLIALTLLLITSITFAVLTRIGIAYTGISLWQVWFFCLVIIFLTLILQKPALEVATRVIYPGSRVDAYILKKWQTELEGVQNWRDLSFKATTLLSGHLGFTTEVKASPSDSIPYSNKPAIICEKIGPSWHFNLSGWEDATPGIIHTAEIFGAILVAGCARLEEALRIAEREKELLKEAHLAELGRISASVAHELRNPLNTISMASTKCEESVRKEIGVQLARAQKLTGDLLTYSGKMKIEGKELNLRNEIEYIVSHYSRLGIGFNIDIPFGLNLLADSHRIHQIFFNLLDNATAVLKGRDDARIGIYAFADLNSIRILVADNGTGIHQKIATDLFRPFVSGRPGGSGLGLAISKRIMEAHGGTMELVSREGWSCCFELTFPKWGLNETH